MIWTQDGLLTSVQEDLDTGGSVGLKGSGVRAGESDVERRSKDRGWLVGIDDELAMRLETFTHALWCGRNRDKAVSDGVESGSLRYHGIAICSARDNEKREGWRREITTRMDSKTHTRLQRAQG